MIHTRTWIPGSDTQLDILFETLRSQQYNNKKDPLWKNYEANIFPQCTALSIAFKDDIPEICGSIMIRDCWPVNTYRILNRMWKCSPRLAMLKKMSPTIASMVKDQMAWLSANTDMELVFISREAENWQSFTMNTLQKDYGLEFKTDNYRYQTCAVALDATCWQHIIYRGNQSLLSQWNKK
jgi:hypothetical protein